MPGVAPSQFLQVLLALGSGLTAARLFSTGLFRKYRFLFAYLLFSVFCVGVSLLLDVKSRVYFLFAVFTQPVVWLLYVGMVLELINLILDRHKGLKTAGKWAMYVGLAASVIISSVTLIPKITPATPQLSEYAMPIIVAVERGLDLSLAIFLILMLLLLNMYTVPLSRNVLVHAVLFTIFFLSNSLGMILRSVFGLEHLETLKTVLLATSSACVFGWFILMGKSGEAARVKLPWFGPEQEERILYHLDSLNASLAKTARGLRP